MNFSNQKQKLKSIKVKFSLKQENNKFIVQATTESDDIIYKTQLPTGLNLKVADLYDYTVEQKNNQRLRVKFSPLVFDFYQKSKYETIILKQRINQLLQQRAHLLNLLSQQNIEIQRLAGYINHHEKMKKQLEQKLNQSFLHIQQLNLIIVNNPYKQTITRYEKSISELNKNNQLLIIQNTDLRKIAFELHQTIDQLLSEKNKPQPQSHPPIDNSIIDILNGIQLNMQQKIQKFLPEGVDYDQPTLDYLEKFLRWQQQQNSNHPRQDKKFQLYRWYPKLKSPYRRIQWFDVVLVSPEDPQQFALLNKSFSQSLKQKQFWSIKYKVSAFTLSVGICSRNIIQDMCFNTKNFNLKNENNGCYLIRSDGLVYSHSIPELNNVEASFRFGEDDIIQMEYNPIDWVLKFRKTNSNKTFEMPIDPIPKNDYYHPCVLLGKRNDRAEIMTSGTVPQ